MIMTFNRDKTYSGWCCTDCLCYLANGDEPSPDYLTEDEITAWREAFERGTQGCEVTLGMFREDHECRTNWTVTIALGGSRYAPRAEYEVLADDAADAWEQVLWHPDVRPHRRYVRRVGKPRFHELETEADRGGECECECQSFSWSQCDVCDSGLGGHRHAVVFWIQPEPAPAHTDEADIARMEADGAGLYAAGV
jgi:hypothetical protein